MNPRVVQIQTTSVCNANCVFCHSGDTYVLMSNLKWKKIKDINIGEEVIGFEKNEKNKWVYKLSKVEEVGNRISSVVKLITDKCETICTPDHKWQDKFHGYRKTINFKKGQEIKYISDPINIDENNDYIEGWICGITDGNGSLSYDNRYINGVQKYRLAVKDLEIINRLSKYAELYNLNYKIKSPYGKKTKKYHSTMHAIFFQDRQSVNHILSILKNRKTSKEYICGYLSGIFDAEGSYSNRNLRITNLDLSILKRVQQYCNLLNIPCKIEYRDNIPYQIIILGGISNHIKFFSFTNPITARKKKAFIGKGIRGNAKVLDVKSIKNKQKVYNIRTTTGNYIANGLFSKNCPYKNSWMVDNPGVMSDKLYLKILNNINYSNPKFKGKFCPYLMNEPFCDKNIIKRVEQAYDILYDPLVEISTNSSLASKNKIDELKEVIGDKRAKIVISLHGINEKSHNKLMDTDWDKSIDNAIYIMKEFNKVPIAIQSMAMSKDRTYNILHPRKIQRFWYKLFKENNINTRNINFSTFQFHNRAGGLDMDWNYNKIVRKIDRTHPFDCKRLHGYLHVLWNGDVVLCCMDYQHEVVIGNLKEQTIEEIYTSKVWKDTYSKCTGKKESPNDFICKRCSSPGG
jgi:hypothetical protein